MRLSSCSMQMSGRRLSFAVSHFFHLILFGNASCHATSLALSLLSSTFVHRLALD